jgi:Flp pilus assembly protein protease CpaA
MIDMIIILALIWVVFAVVQDFKHREIANWLNFSLIIFVIAIRSFYSIFTGDYNYIIFGLFGLGVFFIIAHLFYYARVFAGGDAKLMIALGAVIPMANTFYNNALIFFVFIIALLFAGGIYSLAYSFALVFVNRKKFAGEFKKQFYSHEKYFFIALGLAFTFIILAILLGTFILAVVSLLIFIIPFLYVYTKSIEKTYMINYVEPKKLTIGDWLAEPIKIGNKTINPHWEGLNENQVELIKTSYHKKVLIKQGIPFSPSFLMAFLIILYIKYFMSSNWGFWGL